MFDGDSSKTSEIATVLMVSRFLCRVRFRADHALSDDRAAAGLATRGRYARTRRLQVSARARPRGRAMPVPRSAKASPTCSMWAAYDRGPRILSCPAGLFRRRHLRPARGNGRAVAGWSRDLAIPDGGVIDQWPYPRLKHVNAPAHMFRLGLRESERLARLEIVDQNVAARDRPRLSRYRPHRRQRPRRTAPCRRLEFRRRALAACWSRSMASRRSATGCCRWYRRSSSSA